jgi:Fe-S-cluster-containing hydrogenase component 2/CRP-like cAMP-binding protein
VMADQAESYTIVALEPSLVVEIPKAALYRLMELSAVFRATMDGLYRQRAVWTHALNSPVLAALPEEAVRPLLAEATLQTLPAGQTLYREGEEAAAFYLVRAGFLRASRRFGSGEERVLLYFREGDSFAALPLLVGGRHTITVQANTRAEVIAIPATALQGILAHFPAARNALIAQALQAEKQLQGSPLSAPPKATNSTQLSLSWSSLLDKGVVQGHELLVIDQNRCTNCNNCVDACGRRHGLGRLERRGLQIENLLFPTACRHCEDPVCLLCSVNGIVRLPNGEITIVDDNCIGCGACAQRCPYGNIQMHEVREEEPSLWFDLWDLLRGGVAQWRAVEELNPKKAYKAVKCDLCAGYDDYACVTACPVSAAFRIDPVKAFGRDELLIGLEMKRET